MRGDAMKKGYGVANETASGETVEISLSYRFAATSMHVSVTSARLQGSMLDKFITSRYPNFIYM